MEVWPENWDTWLAWLAMGTQWRIVAGGFGASYEGLDYPSIQAVLWGLGISGRKKRRRIFAGLREMEQAALPVLNDAGD